MPGKTLILAVSLSAQVYKWVQVNLFAGVTLRCSIPPRGEQSLHATETRDKSRSDGPLGSYADFTLTLLIVFLHGGC